MFSPNLAKAVATGLTDLSEYHWQGRAVDEYGNEGPWIQFGGNLEGETDFGISLGVAGGSGGTKSEGVYVSSWLMEETSSPFWPAWRWSGSE